MMATKKIFIPVLILPFVLICLVSGCTSPVNNNVHVIAKIGTVDSITAKEFEMELDFLNENGDFIADYQSIHSALNTMITKRLMAIYTQELGQDSVAKYDEIKKQLHAEFEERCFNDFLYKNYINVSYANRFYKYQNRPVFLQFINIYYSDNQRDAENTSNRTQNQARLLIDSLYYITSPQNFGEIANTYSEYKTRKTRQASKPERIPHNLLPITLEKALFAGASDEISRPVEIPNGYTIMRIVNLPDSNKVTLTPKKLSAVRKQASEKLQIKDVFFLNQIKEDFADTLFSRLNVVFRDSSVASILNQIRSNKSTKDLEDIVLTSIGSRPILKGDYLKPLIKEMELSRPENMNGLLLSIKNETVRLLLVDSLNQVAMKDPQRYEFLLKRIKLDRLEMNTEAHIYSLIQIDEQKLQQFYSDHRLDFVKSGSLQYSELRTLSYKSALQCIDELNNGVRFEAVSEKINSKVTIPSERVHFSNDGQIQGRPLTVLHRKLLRLGVNEITSIVLNEDDSYSIGVVKEIKSDQLPISMDQVKEDVRSKLWVAERNKIMNGLISDLKRRYPVNINWNGAYQP